MTRVISFGLGLLLAIAAGAAPPVAPEQVPYQGVLLDDLGQPRTGSVDLTLRIYDALTGGTLLYTQIFGAVPLTDGVFAVRLGPAGEATDTPTDPLTTSLAAALTGDLGPTAPSRFLEVTVGMDGALSRTQILTVPYALRAESAATAESADLATTAIDVQNVNGLSPTIYSEVFEHFNFDGGPPNNDPSEGLGDTDGDGIANFVDADNDNDTISDTSETAQGSNINIVTPVVSGFAPPSAPATSTTAVTVQGRNFDPGLTVQFGSENPTPSNVTSTSFDVDVGPQASGPANVGVTLPNLETAAASFSFDAATISGLVPPNAPVASTTTVTVQGNGFAPGLTVQFGSESPTPSNVTSTSFDVDVGPQMSGVRDVVVTLPNLDTLATTFTFDPVILSHPATLLDTTSLSVDVSDSGQSVVGGEGEYAVDTDADGAPETVVSFVSPPSNGQSALAWNPSGVLQGLRCRDLGGTSCSAEVYTDSDADFVLEETEAIALQTLPAPGARIWSPGIGHDPSGRVIAGYLARSSAMNTATVAHDRDGDGQFTGINELVPIETFIGSFLFEFGAVVADGSGRAAFVYWDSTAIRVAYDLSGDGDFDDTVGGNPELFTLAPATDLDCVGAAADAGGRLAIVYDEGSGAPVVARDLDGDGDFGGAGETLTLGTSSGDGCAIAGGSALTVVHNADGLRMLSDANDDGDFADADEDVQLAVAPGSERIGVGQSDTLRFVVQDDQIRVEGF